MNTIDKEPQSEIEALLPWHAAGTLSRRDAQRVEDALAGDPELARRYELVRDEFGETIHLNETLGAPSAHAMEKLFAKIDAEPARKPAVSLNLGARVAEFFAGFSPRTLAYAGTEYAAGPQARTIFSFQIDAAIDSLASVPASVTVTRGPTALDRRSGRFVQQLTLRNAGTTPVAGPVGVALDGLSSNATLFTPAGTTVTRAPAGSPVALVNVGADNALTPGETATVTLEFTNPTRAAISYTTRVLSSVTP